MTINDVGIQLVCGLPKAIGDTNSAEKGPFGDGQYIIDLLAFGSGFQISAEDWIPQVAASTPQRAGSGDIVGYTQADIQETINILVTGATPQVVNTKMKKLMMFRRLVEDFWVGTSIEPVYLEWKAAGSPGPQYALIKSFQTADNTSAAEGSLTGEIVISLEREPYWRALPPGANPKLWTFEAAGLVPGVDYDYTDMQLYLATDDMINVTIQNATEMDTNTTFVAKNYVDIPATNLPGDAPPLVSLWYSPTVGSPFNTFYIGHRAARTSTKNRDGYTYPELLDLSAGDAGVYPSTDTTIEADTGGLYSLAYGATRQRIKVSFATLATNAPRVNWGSLSGASSFKFLAANTNGKFAVFARARQTGAADSILLQLQYANDAAGYSIKNEQYPVPVLTGTGNTTAWPIVYLGTLTTPIDGAAAISALDGRGISAIGATAPVDTKYISVVLSAERLSGTGVLYIADVFLLPIDSGGAYISLVKQIDQTGYLSHGKPGIFFAGHDERTVSAVTEISLVPGVNNRFYLFGYVGSTGLSAVSDEVDIGIDIIPRWAGRRDV